MYNHHTMITRTHTIITVHVQSSHHDNTYTYNHHCTRTIITVHVQSSHYDNKVHVQSSLYTYNHHTMIALCTYTIHRVHSTDVSPTFQHDSGLPFIVTTLSEAGLESAPSFFGSIYRQHCLLSCDSRPVLLHAMLLAEV